MRRYWDRRAREDALYFVDNRRAYGDAEEREFWEEGERALDLALELLGLDLEPGSSIVDIGCGVGRITRALAKRAGLVYGVDVSPEMLDRARQHNPGLSNVRWLLGDGSSLAGIEDGSVDGCVSLVVFQHIPEPGPILAYVREIGRVVRPGGYAAVQVSNSPGVHRRPGPFARVRGALTTRLRHAPRGQHDSAWLGTAIDLDDLRNAAAESGLEVGRVVGEGTQFCLVALRRLSSSD